MIKCDKCENIISDTIQRSDGLPNGVGMQLEDGRTITICADCINEIGRLKEAGDDEGLNNFFRELGVEV